MASMVLAGADAPSPKAFLSSSLAVLFLTAVGKHETHNNWDLPCFRIHSPDGC
jgi:hypothetical protein